MTIVKKRALFWFIVTNFNKIKKLIFLFFIDSKLIRLIPYKLKLFTLYIFVKSFFMDKVE